ncbi:hypothetical protein GBZ26_11310 [Azospirillum formosense]|uniref:Uncharacterized protein n=1 Tax=Azospirillum formosense TaxID=861533 RepID=A0ABX2KY69_9PROT|nr:hypothetical protein [Azospirillum formosense]MBY3756719.1 hypothetical protein [Azospirillum formosense]NUB19799.1 hypothetical protein [Azospirillum formosense]
MNIPAHRAAAVEPTPADTFEMKDGKTVINLTEQERAKREAAEQAEREKQQAADSHAEAEPAPDATSIAEPSPKPAKAAGQGKATTQTKEA